MTSNKALVTGEIGFPTDVDAFSGATAYVRLEDVSLLDAPSKLIAEQVIRGVVYHGDNSQKIPFRIEAVPPEDTRARLQLSVHISRDGSDAIEKGDFITVESYPVLTHEHPSHITVYVQRV